MDYDIHGWHLLHLRDPDRDAALPVSEADVAVIFHDDSNGSIKRNLNVYLPSAKAYAFPAFPAEGEKIHVDTTILNPSGTELFISFDRLLTFNLV